MEKKKTTGKHSLEYVQNKFKENGCELLSKEYVRTKDKLIFKCKCTEIKEITFKQYILQLCCKECKAPKIGKHTIESLKVIFQGNGCELLSTEYKGNKSELQFKCKCEAIESITYKKYQTQNCCTICHSESLTRTFKYTFEEVKIHFEKEKCTLITENYTGQLQKLEYICICGNTYKQMFKTFLRGDRCPICTDINRKQTNLLIYGNIVSANAKQLKDIWMEKCKNKTKEEKYAIRVKTINTVRQRFGVDHVLQAEEVKQKGIVTNYIKYGERHRLQNAEEFDFNNGARKMKDYTLPSGKVIEIQGYENFALDILLELFKEDEIKTLATHMPRIMYLEENIERRYFPDIFIPSINKIIEVKSYHTYEKELSKNLLKAKAVEDLNIEYEVWIMDNEELLCII